MNLICLQFCRHTKIIEATTTTTTAPSSSQQEQSKNFSVYFLAKKKYFLKTMLCAVKNCNRSRRSNGQNLKMFRFPADKTMKQLWMKLLRIESLPKASAGADDHNQICSV